MATIIIQMNFKPAHIRLDFLMNTWIFLPEDVPKFLWFLKQVRLRTLHARYCWKVTFAPMPFVRDKIASIKIKHCLQSWQQRGSTFQPTQSLIKTTAMCNQTDNICSQQSNSLQPTDLFFLQYKVVQILVINIGICFASCYNVFQADNLKLL